MVARMVFMDDHSFPNKQLCYNYVTLIPTKNSP